MISPSFHRCGYAGSPYRLQIVSLALEKLKTAINTCKKVNNGSIYLQRSNVIIVSVSMHAKSNMSSD